MNFMLQKRILTNIMILPLKMLIYSKINYNDQITEDSFVKNK